MIKPDNNAMYTNEEYKIFMQGYNQGFTIGYKTHEKETKDMTFRDHYEKLCEEIRESVIKEVLEKIEGYYHEQTTK